MRTPFILAILLCPACTSREAPAHASESAQGIALSASDSQQITQLVNGFTGLERYYLLLVPDSRQPCGGACLEARIEKLKQLLEYRHRPPPDVLRNHRSSEHFVPMRIDTLDARNGYMRLLCRECEHSETLALWSQSDGSKLIGSVSRDCGPRCTDVVAFWRASGDRVRQVPTDSILPGVHGSMFSADSAAYAARYGDDNPEIDFDLPQRGTTIQVTLVDVEAGDSLFRGSHLDLVWNDGVFRIGRIHFK